MSGVGTRPGDITDKAYAMETRLNSYGFYSDTAGINRYVDASSQQYCCGEHWTVLTSAFTITSTSSQLVTPLQHTVQSGPGYAWRSMIRIKQGATSNVQNNIGFGGPASSNSTWFYLANNQSQAVGAWTVVGGFGSLIGSSTTLANNQELYMYAHGTTNFTASGTFGVYGSISTANFVFQPGTYFAVRMM